MLLAATKVPTLRDVEIPQRPPVAFNFPVADSVPFFVGVYEI